MSEIQRRLIDACNVLCDHVCGKLPEGWELTLTFRRGEPDLTLFNPDGDEVEVATADSGCSSVDAACVEALSAESSAVDHWS